MTKHEIAVEIIASYGRAPGAKEIAALCRRTKAELRSMLDKRDRILKADKTRDRQSEEVGRDPLECAGRKTIFHGDGTVTFWNGHLQQWERRSARWLVEQCATPYGYRILPTLSEADRRRIIRIAERV